MTRCVPRGGPARPRWSLGPVVAAAVLTLSSCGLPRDGSARTVDKEDVPYRLLESDAPSTTSLPPQTGPARAPVVFWLADDHLVPEATEEKCSEPPEVVVDRLLSTLSAGPSDEGRAIGRSSTIPPDFRLDLVGIVDGTAEVDIEPETSLSAERLPVAVAQVVLTVTSAPTVRAVVLVTGGEPVQLPLPEGVLTGDPVTAGDYDELVAARFRGSDAFGCPGL